MAHDNSDSIELESLRGVVEDLAGTKDDVQLWRAEYGELVAIGETRADALRVIARKLDDNSGGRVDDPTDMSAALAAFTK